MAKDHNTSIPILDAIEILRRHGMGVVSGIILDINTNTHETPARIGDFVRRFSISMLTINLRQALPLTSLRAETYSPEELYRRFTGNAERTDPNRIRPPASARRASRSNLSRLLLHAGLLADYRAHFRRLAVPLLRQGRIEDVIRVGLGAHHLITFGKENASFYSSKLRWRGAETASMPRGSGRPRRESAGPTKLYAPHAVPL